MSSMTSTKLHLKSLVDREADFPTRCDNGWTRTLLVLASIWVGIAAYARSCEVATRCTSTFGSVACSPFTLGGALSACSMRACALKSQGSSDLNYMSTVLSNNLNTLTGEPRTDATDTTIRGARSGQLLRNPKWLSHAYKGASTLQVTGSKDANLRHIIDLELSGSCHPGQWKQGIACTSIPTTPYGLTETAMDTSVESSLETRACGVWSKSVRKRCASCPRQYFTLQSSLYDEDARWKATYDRIQLRGGSRGPAGTLMSRCVTLRQAGTASIAATMQLSYSLLKQRMPPLTTVSNVLRSLGQLSGYGCNSLVRLGTTVGLRGVSVQVANMAPISSTTESLRMMNQANALRTSLIMKEVVSLSPVTMDENGLPIHSIWDGTGLTASHRAKYDACHIEQIAGQTHVPQAWHLQQLLYGARGVDLSSTEQNLFDGQTFQSLVYLRRLLCLLSDERANVPEVTFDAQNDASLGMFGKDVATAVVESLLAMCVRSMGEALNAGVGKSTSSSDLSSVPSSVPSSALGRVHPIRNAAGEHAVGANINTTRFEGSPLITRESVLENWKQPSVVVVDLDQETKLDSELRAVHALEETTQMLGESTDVFDDVMRSPTSHEYTRSALVTVNDLRRTRTQDVAFVTTMECGALVGFVAPSSMDHAAFQTRFTKRMLARLESLFDTFRTKMLQTVNQMSNVFKDVSLIEYAFLNVRVRIPGATQSDSATFGGKVSSVSRTVDNTDAYELQWQADVVNGAFQSADGVLLNMLDSARATKRLQFKHAVSDEVKDPCELLPLYDAQLVNAYYMFPSNCIVMFLGMATDNVLNDGYDDATLLSRYGWVLAHELAHASMWSRRFKQPYDRLLQRYGSFAKEEGLADILAAVATTKAAGGSNAYTTLLNVAQVFCVSDVGLSLDHLLNSHPSSTNRASLACQSIQSAYERGELDVSCTGS